VGLVSGTGGAAPARPLPSPAAGAPSHASRRRRQTEGEPTRREPRQMGALGSLWLSRRVFVWWAARSETLGLAGPGGARLLGRRYYVD
jgi:hypothetical protein